MSGIQLVKSHDLADHWNTQHFGPLTDFFSLVFRPPFEYRTQIYHLNTRLDRYSDGYYTTYIGIFIQYKTNKTGLQTVSRPMEQVDYFEGWGVGAK